jgi:HK97 family phage major capsid protein
MRAALGTAQRTDAAITSHPGATGHQEVSTKGSKVKTTAERIAEFEAKRAANAGRMAAIMEESNEKGSTLDGPQREEYDTLTDEIKEVDEHIARLKTLENVQISRGTAVTTATASNTEDATKARGGNAVIFSKRNLPQGTSFARYAQALAMSKGNLMQALQIAKTRWPDTPEVETVLRSAVNYGSTTDSDFAEPLVEYQTMANEFIDLLRPATILGKLTGLRRVPFNIRVAGKTSSSTVGWVGQGSPKPVSEVHFNETTLGFAKAAGIVVISQELARFSSPSAEALIRQDLVDTMAEFMDAQFISPSVAAVANVSPASITNGLTPVSSTGSTLAQITADVSSAFQKFINADLAPTKGVWIMKPVTALGLALKRTSQDVFAFPDINLNGGTWFGLPVIVSDAVPGSASGGTIIVLLDQSEVFYADDGQVRLDVSEQASLQMDSAPSAGAQSLVSLWQNNLIGIRAERFMNWARRRDAAVTYIDFVPTY